METLRSKVEKMLSDAVDRVKNLNNDISQYKAAMDFESARNADIRKGVMEVVIRRLEDCLKTGNDIFDCTK